MPPGMTEERARYVREYKQVVKLLGGKCWVCGSTKDLKLDVIFEDEVFSGYLSGALTDMSMLRYAQQHPERAYVACNKHSKHQTLDESIEEFLNE